MMNDYLIQCDNRRISEAIDFVSIKKIFDDKALLQTVLNSFSFSNNSVCFILDLSKDVIYFSDFAVNLLRLSSPKLKQSEWVQFINEKDRERVVKIFSKTQKGKQKEHNVVYQIYIEGLTFDIVHRGHLILDMSKKPAFIMGNIMPLQNDEGDVTLPNKKLKEEIQLNIISGYRGYLMIIGVDNMKRVNAIYGRNAGDILLKDLMQIIEEEVDSSNKVYRFNGDCFALNVFETSEVYIKSLYQRIKIRVRDHFSISAGVVSYSECFVKEAAILLQYAESALDYAKFNGKDQLNFFSEEHYEKRLFQIELYEDMCKSIKNGFEGFYLDYQPQFSSQTYQIKGAEALLRYSSKKYGNVSPEVFIPLIEQTKYIHDLGMWVLKKACKQTVEFQKYDPKFAISINFSYAQLSGINIENRLLSTIKKSGLDPKCVTIEMTESIGMYDYPQINSIFKLWKAEGIHISIDDFGTGYSSLQRLKEMEVDEIKIDRCFVQNVQESAYNYRLISNIIELAKASEMYVVCEGIETKEELRILEQLHPDLYQGYLFSKPIDPKKLISCFFKGEDSGFADLSPEKNDYSSINCIKDKDITKYILNSDNNYYILTDTEDYSIRYMNASAMKLYGVKTYKGKKCYRVLHGLNAPCPFCNNEELSTNDFLIWENRNEYCQRHFLSKVRLLEYNNRLLRLEISQDVTKKEYISKASEERLQFAKTIRGYIENLAISQDLDKAMGKVLFSVCEFYKADRAYLFEVDPEDSTLWDNTLEYCTPLASPQMHNLQQISQDYIARWIPYFEKNESIILLNLESIKDDWPKEYSILLCQDVQRLIVVPIRDEGNTIAFIGVDNPRYSIHDDTQIRVLATFLLLRYIQNRNEKNHQRLFEI